LAVLLRLLVLWLLLLPLGLLLALLLRLLELVQQQVGEFQIVAGVLRLGINVQTIAVIGHRRTQVGQRFLGTLEGLQGLLILDIAEIVFDLAFELAIGGLECLRVVLMGLAVILLLVRGIPLVEVNFRRLR